MTLVLCRGKALIRNILQQGPHPDRSRKLLIEIQCNIKADTCMHEHPACVATAATQWWRQAKHGPAVTTRP